MTLTRDDLRIIIDGLQRILADPSNTLGGTRGLCDRLNSQLAANKRPQLRTSDLAPYFRRWPEFSGSSKYPVPCSKTELERLLRLNDSPPSHYFDYNLDTPAGRAEAAFMQTLVFRAATTQRYTGEYGQARLRLAAFLLAEFEAELNQPPPEFKETNHEP